VRAFEELVQRHTSENLPDDEHITRNREDAETRCKTRPSNLTHTSRFPARSRLSWLGRIAATKRMMSLPNAGPNTFRSTRPVEGDELRPASLGLGAKPEQRFARRQMHEIRPSHRQARPDFRVVFTLRDIEELFHGRDRQSTGHSMPAEKSRFLRARTQLDRR